MVVTPGAGDGLVKPYEQLIEGFAGTALEHGETVVLAGGSGSAFNMAFQQIDRCQLLALMALFFIGAHFKDIKDIVGDRVGGVVTLPTLLGAERAYWTIGGSVLAGAALLMILGVLISHPLSWLALGLFAAGWLLLRNAERLFWVMLVSLSLLFAAQGLP